MNLRTLLAVLFAVAVAACFTAPAFTEEPAEEPAAPHGDPMTEAMKALGTPGPDHAWMGFMVGSWDVGTKMWWGPGEPQTSTGQMESHWMMGRRFVRSIYLGDMDGVPFRGEATMGFSNATSQYESAWMDSGSTSMSRGTGKRDGDSMVLTGTNVFPMMGGEIPFRTVYTKKSDDQYVMEDFWTMEGKGETKIMELTFTRAK